MKTLVRIAASLLAMASPMAAQAGWRQAASRHFIVHSEGSEQSLREATVKLEKLHFVLRTMHNVTRAPSPLKLRVFLMKNADGVAATLAGGGSGVQGYYDANDRGPFLVGTRSAGGTYTGLDPEIVLQHEYAHGFMFEYFPATYPTWYVEGFAEFWGATKIGAKDVVEIGRPAGHRYESFQGNRWLPMRRILGARSYGDISEPDLIYAQGWLLLRYLFDNKARSGQLQKYVNAINKGVPYEQATNDAFGEDAKALDAELSRYSGVSRMRVLQLPFKPIDAGPIAIRTMSSAEDALIDSEIRLSRGLLAREVPTFSRDVRRIAARYPDDPHALLMLAHAERLAGNHVAALATADRVLVNNPAQPRALVEKAMATLAGTKISGASPAAWDEARKPLVRAVALAPKDPFVLQAFYDSFALQNVLPPAEAQNALFTAHELAPADNELRYRVALDFERRGMVEDALSVIRPAALAMHHSETEKKKKEREETAARDRLAGRNKHETALEMMRRLETKLGAGKAPTSGS